MGFIKRSLVVTAIVGVLAVGFARPVQAADLSAAQIAAIAQNCSDIRQSLAKLQVVDSRTRTYLGSTYEAISGRFLTPLNLRLVKNGLPSNELFRIQNEFTVAQTDFRTDYVEYMREMDALIATDCVNHPQDFYKELEKVRKRRAELRAATQKLSDLTTAQYKAVTDLRATL